jgi:hypothetical protein
VDWLDVLGSCVSGCSSRRMALVLDCCSSAHKIATDEVARPAINLVSRHWMFR